ncbi:hypothetical protein AAG570_013635 [Ranatra chinensis]|uniref:Uncharacterized protein n=1 Tax=Ranatra chinensis TaxID=642074 RepID=A0ABD0Z115_9HEMI
MASKEQETTELFNRKTSTKRADGSRRYRERFVSPSKATGGGVNAAQKNKEVLKINALTFGFPNRIRLVAIFGCAVGATTHDSRLVKVVTSRNLFGKRYSEQETRDYAVVLFNESKDYLLYLHISFESDYSFVLFQIVLCLMMAYTSVCLPEPEPQWGRRYGMGWGRGYMGWGRGYGGRGYMGYGRGYGGWGRRYG